MSWSDGQVFTVPVRELEGYRLYYVRQDGTERKATFQLGWGPCDPAEYKAHGFLQQDRRLLEWQALGVATNWAWYMRTEDHSFDTGGQVCWTEPQLELLGDSWAYRSGWPTTNWFYCTSYCWHNGMVRPHQQYGWRAWECWRLGSHLIMRYLVLPPGWCEW